VVFSAAVRIETALDDPGFDARDPAGMLKSDPALLYHFTERILAAGGGVPADFRADPRVQWPALTDVPAEFTVGQEFLVAWAARALGGDVPLHVRCVQVMAVVASLAAAGAYGLALARTASVPWALFAAALFVLLPASYRTIGFVLVREDLSFPLFALHLAVLARARRMHGAPGCLAAGALLAAALATWHAMVFVVALEAACVFAWFLRTGRTPFAVRGAWSVLVAPALAGVLVPALRAKLFLLAPPMLFAWALAAAELAARRGVARSLRTGLALAVALVGLLAAYALSRTSGEGLAGYGHVLDVVVAKLVHLGRLPADPRELSFDARLLWQGPFETLPALQLALALGWPLALGVPALAGGLRAWGRGRQAAGALIAAMALASLPLAWLFARALVLPALLVPVLGASFLARRATRPAAVAAAAVLLLQAGAFAAFVRDHRISWYLPPGRQVEIAALVRWTAANLAPEEPVCADFVTSPAILAHSGNPIVLQPKYETVASRRRAAAFFEAFFHRPPAELHELVRARFRCRTLVVDRYTLWYAGRYAGGVPLDAAEPPPGTAAAAFLSQDDAVLRGVPGFELVYRSPASIRQSDGSPYDLYRVYRLVDR
jgi:hypothetical protein